MGTRSDSIDAEIVLHLMCTGKLELEEIERALETESGLLGLSGSTRVDERHGRCSPERQAEPCSRFACSSMASSRV